MLNIHRNIVIFPASFAQIIDFLDFGVGGRNFFLDWKSGGPQQELGSRVPHHLKQALITSPSDKAVGEGQCEGQWQSKTFYAQTCQHIFFRRPQWAPT